MSRTNRRYERLVQRPYRRVAQQLSDHPDWIPTITEGDSWFAFPALLWRRNIIGHLQRTFDARMAMLLMSHNGDTVAEIMAGDQRRRLRYALQHKFRFRMLLFSAGGNDIVDAMPRILTKKCRGVGWRKCIRDEVVDEVLDDIRDAYSALLQLRDRHNPRCHIFTHAYDFPTVNGEPIRILGKPISKPPITSVFRKKGFTSKSDQRAIVRHVLGEFHDMLYDLRMESRRFTVVDTRGTLHSSHWKDEMHPSDRGFGLVAKRFGRAILRRFPRALSRRKLNRY